MLRIIAMLSCIVCMCACISFWRSFGLVVAWIVSICDCINVMFVCIWDIWASIGMLIAGFAGAAWSCAEANGATRAQVTKAATSIEVFNVVLPSGLN